jgi:glucosamine kinase
MAFFLGFDVGGTKTVCALGDDTQVLARATGGSIKPLRVTIEQAQENLAALLLQLSQKAGIDLRIIAASCIGTAGVRLPQTDGWMRRILSPHAGGEIVICGDEEIALDAAFPGGAGVLAMAGTGSNVMGRTSFGEMLNVGGWGPMLGDEASGYWIGHQALRSACRLRDFGQHSLILDRVVEFWSAANLDDVLSIGNQTPPPDFSLLAGIVAECAEQGDAIALDVLLAGGRLLGEAAVEAYRGVRRLEPETDTLPGVAFTGSILEKIAFVRNSMIDTIRQSLPMVSIVPHAVDSIEGALWRARQAVID